jgi:hypothetical protein
MVWKKGESGNPRGRAAEKPFADALKMEIKAAGEDHQQLRMIARKLLDKAADGDMSAINCLADRLDGKPSQAVELSAPSRKAADLSDNELAAIAVGSTEENLGNVGTH